MAVKKVALVATDVFTPYRKDEVFALPEDEAKKVLEASKKVRKATDAELKADRERKAAQAQLTADQQEQQRADVATALGVVSEAAKGKGK